jgi:glycosyltransferase involved in cell wall biosynthesis
VQKVSGVSGSEAHLLSLLPRLRARGFDASMLVLHENEPGAHEFVERMRTQDVPTETWRMRFDLDPRVPARLALRRPDVLHTHLVHADLLGLPAGALARVPVRISTKHGFNEFRSSRAIATADRAVARLAHRQIAISAGLADYLAETEGFDRGAFTVVHYGIEPGPEPPPPPVEPRLVAVGRLIPIKGLDVLLRAFAAARAEVPELTLEIAGAGPAEAELRAAAPDGVTFLGRVDGVGPLYERSLLAVVPSRGEGFGMVALEAAERGRAAIVSRVGGLPEIVADGETGVVVPPEDSAALARAIVELARDPDRARTLGAAARQRAVGSFSAEAAADRIADLYRQELSTRSTVDTASSASRKSNTTR